jgi:hypothetical protein
MASNLTNANGVSRLHAHFSLSGILSLATGNSFEIVIALHRLPATSMSNFSAVSFLRCQDCESLMTLFFSRALEQELEDGSSFLSKAKNERLHSD